VLPVIALLQVFYPGQSRPVFFVASRGHHADIGGITPGSMPPHSRYLHEEGAVFKSFKLVDRGVFQEEGRWTYSCGGWHDAVFEKIEFLIGCANNADLDLL